MEGFRFNIGDTVVLKRGIDECHMAAKLGMKIFPTCCTVLEQLAQECPGGIQRHYKLAANCGEHFTELEIALAHPSELDAEANHRIYITAHVRELIAEMTADAEWEEAKAKKSKTAEAPPT